MEVPCPVPLLQPWSPVGYRVVQLADETVPAPGQPPLVILAEPCPPHAPSPRAPRSPIGYRVTLVADEIIPVESTPEPYWDDVPRTIALPRERRRPHRAELWIPLVAIACFVLLPALALMAMMGSRPHAQPAAPVAVVIPQAIAAQPQVAVVPDAIRAEGAAAPGADPPPAANAVRLAKILEPPAGPQGDACPPDAAPRPGRDVFQTAVEFVRNPQEAARLAKQDNKLTFILHLSGNFEDPGFT